MNINLDKVFINITLLNVISIMIGNAFLNLNLIFFDLLVILLLFQKNFLLILNFTKI